MSADGAHRLFAGVRMDKDVSLAAEVGVENSLKLLHFSVNLSESEVSGQDKVEIQENSAAGTPSAKTVDINPSVFAVMCK